MKILLWILGGAAWLGLAACSRPEAVSTPKPPAVTVAAVAQRPVPVYGQYVGQTEAVKTVDVRARVEGFIDRQAAPDGADVKAGDLLFVIDPRPFEASLRQAQANVARDSAQLRQTEAALVQREADVQQAQANLERDQAQLENARTQERRYRTLLQQELVAGEQYDQLRTNMTALEATVQADRAAFNRFFHAMLEQGVYLAPSAYEAGFVSAAHGEAEIDATLAAARRAFTSGTASPSQGR